MCGIAGAVGNVDATVIGAVRRAAEAQAHRGPDAHGLWTGEGAVLAHRRLSIIDLSEHANQPMVDAETGVVLSFNGEIYNYRELRKELTGLGDTFHTQSDTEVLLKAVVRWGSNCVDRLRGMFAFAAWDPRTDVMLLVRDRLGIKPLYLARVRHAGGEVVLFASELRAILATHLVEKRIDQAGLASYLWNGFVTGPATIIRGVTRLDPGSMVEIDRSRLNTSPRRYWRLPSFREPAADGVEALSAELESAVRMRLVSDVPLGIFLSGGVDSSAVAALARRTSTGGSLRTFSVSFDEASYDEAPHARRVAEGLETEHAELRLTERMFVDRLDDALSGMDHPTFDGINTYFVSRAAREAGVTVALAGIGGDELFGGYRSFSDLPQLMRWRRRLALLPTGVVRHGAAATARMKLGPSGDVPPQTRWGKLGEALTARGNLLDLYQLAYAMFLPEFQSELRGDVDVAGLRSGLSPMAADAMEAWTRGDPPLHAIATMELANFVGERLLPDVDAASMAVSMELRVPLLDHRVVERAAGVDVDRRFMPLGRKALLRELALGGLDPSIFERPKSGFVLPIEAWCRRGMREVVAQTLLDEAGCASVGLCGQTVARLWRAFEAESPGIYWSRIWALFVLIQWCRSNRVVA